MAYSRGRCLLKPLLQQKSWTQTELARRSKFSPRMISHFCQYDGMGNGKPMSPEAMYTISHLLEVPMEALYEWIEIGDAE